MRYLVLIACLGACGGAEEEPPPVSSETLQVTIQWSWVRALSDSCDGKSVIDCTGCNATCSFTGGGYNAVEQCCSDSKVIYASGRNRVLADYTRCDISNPTDELLVVDCPLDGNTPIWFLNDGMSYLAGGTPYKYTNASCDWNADYPGP